MAKPPIDLRERFGSRYRIERDPAAKDEPGGRKDPWFYVIPCRKGHIYPHSFDRLALWWESSARLDRQCLALTLYPDGDDEKVYLVPPSGFPRRSQGRHAPRTPEGQTFDRRGTPPSRRPPPTALVPSEIPFHVAPEHVSRPRSDDRAGMIRGEGMS